MSGRYHDLDGNECSLHRLVVNNPGWAEARIQVGETALEQRDELIILANALLRDPESRSAAVALSKAIGRCSRGPR